MLRLALCLSATVIIVCILHVKTIGNTKAAKWCSFILPCTGYRGLHTCHLAMDIHSQKTKDKRQSPMERAGIFSMLFFWWMNDTLKLGSKRPLQDEDLFPLQDEFKTEALVDKLEMEWYKETNSCAHENKHPRLWKVMFRMFSCKRYLILGAVKLAHSVSSILLPVTVWLFLKSLYEDASVNQASTVLRVVGISVATVVKGMSHHHSFFLAGICGMQLKVSVIGLIYKKVKKIFKFYW